MSMKTQFLTQIGQRPDIYYFLSDIEKQISYDELHAQQSGNFEMHS